MSPKPKTTKGGARLAGNPTNYYVGWKNVLPKGYDKFAHRNIAYKCGRRVGFAAGIDTGRKQTVKDAVKKAVVLNELKSKVVKPAGSWIYKKDIKPTIAQRSLQQIAKHLRISNFSQAKETLLPLVMEKQWTRVDSKHVLLDK